MTAAYLSPLDTDSSGNPAATSEQPTDPSKTSNWVQSGAWTVLPGNVYFDINYSVLHGMNMSVNFGGSSAPTGEYSYYHQSSHRGHVRLLTMPGQPELVVLLLWFVNKRA